MSRSVPVSYERQPPIGNSLIDDEAGAVFIRILPDRNLGRWSSWVFAAAGVAVLIFAFAQMQWTRVGLLQSVPILFLAALMFLLCGMMRYNPRRRLTTLTATADAIEFADGGFAPRRIDRASIQQVFTRDAPFSRRVCLGIRFVDGGDMIFGTGDAKEIDAMARALHRVLNNDRSPSDPSHVK